MPAKEKEKGALSIHTENIFPIIKKWLYSQHDIFLRELISNSTDALNKLKYARPEADTSAFKIEIKLDKKKKTLQVIDNGIGMTDEEIRKYINQIAFSGAEEFVEKFKDVQSNIIGHFGLGFYSSFMVADKVTIDSLSYVENSEPAFWECDGTTEYVMSKGKRKDVGTTVTIHFNDESSDYLETAKIQSILEKYCNFMPYPIEFDGKTVNQKEALWNKKPADVTEDEYREFYKKLFHDWQDPIFWIHLNVDYPFNLKGILYFPKLRNEPDFMKGEVKLFCNNVFVADNLEDLVPEFLLLLKGGIDIPDIPLNVSRSFLQNDKQVQKITRYIVKKVADHFAETFKSDRKKYEQYWEDIQSFIKYGLLKDDEFFDAMKDIIVFKSSAGDYVTMEEYKARNPASEGKTKVYYASSEDTQVSYLNLMKEQGIEVIFQTSPLDTHLFQKLESKLENTEFLRIDSELNELLINKDSSEPVDLDNQTDTAKLKEIFDKALNSAIEANFYKDSYAEFIKKHPQVVELLTPYITQNGEQSIIKPYELPAEIREKLGSAVWNELFEHVYTDVKVEVKSLKTPDISGMIVFNEFMRRWHDMDMLASREGSGMLKNHTLIVNKENPTIGKILQLAAEGKTDEVKNLCAYIHDLSMLEQKAFSGAELKDFLARANQILKYIN
jgi:molecular chaperone HtpG